MNDWDDLHCFTVLVEKQTLTAAAETLGVHIAPHRAAGSHARAAPV